MLAGQVSANYDSDEFSLGVVTNQSLKSRGGSLLYVNAFVAHHLVVRSDQTITVKLVSAAGVAGPAITVEGGIPFEDHYIEHADVLVTTTQANNPLKVIVA